jgi:hydrogenase 3 maturation protease
MMQMSKPPWHTSLSQKLKPNAKHGSTPRVAVVGIGHELRGDDAAGLAVARALQGALGQDKDWLVIDAGSAPENQTGALRRFGPDVVLFIDAAQMDKAPGVIQWLSWEETEGISASTHTLPLSVLARYLIGELGCEVALLCIQPADDAIGVALSPSVTKAVDSIVSALLGLYREIGRLAVL